MSETIAPIAKGRCGSRLCGKYTNFALATNLLHVYNVKLFGYKSTRKVRNTRAAIGPRRLRARFEIKSCEAVLVASVREIFPNKIVNEKSGRWGARCWSVVFTRDSTHYFAVQLCLYIWNYAPGV